VAGDAHIVGLGIAALAESPESIEEVGGPADKQQDHQIVNIDDQFIDIIAVDGGEFRQSKKLFRELFHEWAIE